MDHFRKTFGLLALILLLLIFIPQDIWEVHGDNVALMTNGTLCDELPLPRELFDGDRTNVVTLSLSNCTHTETKNVTEIQVNLEERYYVHYVVLYGVQGNSEGQLDFFRVIVFYDDESKICGIFPGQIPSNYSDDGSERLNCLPKLPRTSRLQFNFYTNESFELSEIEVHSIGPLHFNIPLIYRGCYANVELSYRNKGNWIECVEKCSQQNIVLAAMRGDECGCASKFMKMLKMTGAGCSVRCNDSNRLCGGRLGYSVYLTYIPLPHHKSCAAATSEYILDFPHRGVMTPGKCLRKCDHEEFFILQNADYCKCAKDAFIDMGWEDRYVERCDSECTGDSRLKCGGYDHVSIYSTCLFRNSITQKIHLKCSVLLQCSGTHDMFGVCLDGCRSGYKGIHCLEQIIYECDFEPCDSLTSSCRDLGGSYTCDCYFGYKKEANEICVVSPLFYLFLFVIALLTAVAAGLGFKRAFKVNTGEVAPL